MKRIILLLFFIVLLIPGLFQVETKQAQASIWDFFNMPQDILSIKGNQVFSNNNPIFLRGVAVGDPHSRQTVYQRNINDYAVIKNQWKANIVRLSVHPGAYRSDEKSVNKILDDEIKAARSNGMYVIIDWHVIGFPNGWYKPWAWGDQHYYSYDTNFHTASEFWKSMAVEYRNDRGIIFELWNEPADQNKIDWQKIKPYMQRLHDIIRANGAQNIIIAPGVYWTYDLRGIKNSPLQGENIGYVWHTYPGSGKYLSWSTALDGLEKKYPIFVTEWGFSTNPNGNQHHYSDINSYPKDFKNFLLNKNLNFTAWCWHNPWDPRMFDYDWKTLTDFGSFVKNFLSEIEGMDEIRNKVNNFVWNGVDYNTLKLGEGERRAVVYSFQEAFGRYPATLKDYSDIVKIANGRWPEQRSSRAEDKAKESFRYIYQREPNMNNSRDNAAITVMAYGLRQRAENRNLNSERVGIGIFRSLYRRVPCSTEDWNIMQAITYSGAKR